MLLLIKIWSEIFSHYQFLSRVFISNFIRLNFPYRLNFALTYKCNLKCKMCFIWKKNVSDELNFYDIDKFFRKSNFFSWITLTGGEIFLREDLFFIIKSITKNVKDLCVLNFATNGYNTNTIIREIEHILSLDIPRLFITLSIDGDKETHNYLRGYNDVWQKSINTYMELKKYRNIKVILSMTISSYNYNKIKKTIEEIQQVCYNFNPKKDMNINIFHNSEHFYENSKLYLTEIQKEKIIKEIEKLISLFCSKEFGIRSYLVYNHLKYCKIFLKEEIIPLKCQALSSSCFLTPNGEVYPCIIYNSSVGNIKKFDFDIRKIWHNLNTIKLYYKCRNAICPHCWTPCESFQCILGNYFKCLFNYISLYFTKYENF